MKRAFVDMSFATSQVMKAIGRLLTYLLLGGFATMVISGEEGFSLVGVVFAAFILWFTYTLGQYNDQA